jgi:hypothetical protein
MQHNRALDPLPDRQALVILYWLFPHLVVTVVITNTTDQEGTYVHPLIFF